MKAVDIAVRTTEDKVQVDVTMLVERRKPSNPDIWEPVENKSVTYWTGTDQAGKRTILLEDDERLVVMGKSDIQMVYDRKQKSVVMQKIGTLSAPETARLEAQLKQQEELKEAAMNDALFRERLELLRQAQDKLDQMEKSK